MACVSRVGLCSNNFLSSGTRPLPYLRVRQVQRRLETYGHATERLEVATFSCLALVGVAIGQSTSLCYSLINDGHCGPGRVVASRARVALHPSFWYSTLVFSTKPIPLSIYALTPIYFTGVYCILFWHRITRRLPTSNPTFFHPRRPRRPVFISISGLYCLCGEQL